MDNESSLTQSPTPVILIADDSYDDRAVLASAFTEGFSVREAASVVETLALLRTASVSLVVLSLTHLEDNHAVLTALRKEPALAHTIALAVIPGHDEKSQVRALDAGAADVINRPISSRTLQARVRNLLERQESQRLLNEQETLRRHIQSQQEAILQSERDGLTGLYTRDAFCRVAAEKIAEKPAGFYVLCSFDVDNFKVVNDQYGQAIGDAVLKCIGETVRSFTEPYDCIGSRKFTDNFAMLFPHAAKETFYTFINQVNARLLASDLHLQIQLSAGCYLVTELGNPVSVMLDLALLAKRTVKGRYDVHRAYYSADMRNHLLQEQWVISEMGKALADHQFQVWFQPQYNHASGALMGAEALVRWQHPEKGMLPPSLFISVFERNGFIYELDKYVWEETCRYLRRWMDNGLKTPPVSVNVSRYDAFRPDFLSVINGLIEQYDIPRSLFRLEITESAFAKSSDQLVAVVKKLQESGLIVEIDDFGSGYSSFNTLKDVPADVLKIDMRFLQGNDHTSRGGNILESIVRMAGWLNMAVVAEGVETHDQANFLLSIGCECIQGYFYSKPVDITAFEKLMRSGSITSDTSVIETIDQMNPDAFWNPSSIETLVFNRYAGGACVFEVFEDRSEVLRVNPKYISAFKTCLTEAEVLRKGLLGMFSADCGQIIHAAIERAAIANNEECFELPYDGRFDTKPHTEYLRFTIRMVARVRTRRMYYAYVENITAQRSAEQEAMMNTERLQLIMNGVGSGVLVATIENDLPIYYYANQCFYAQRGWTKEEFEAQLSSPLDCVHPDDRAMALDALLTASRTNTAQGCLYRVCKKDGSLIWIQNIITNTRFKTSTAPTLTIMTSDVTAIKEAQRELATTARQFQLLNDIAHVLLTDAEHSAAIIQSLQKIRDYFNSDRAYVVEITQQQQIASESYEVCADGVAPCRERMNDFLREKGAASLDYFRGRNGIAILDIGQLGDPFGDEKKYLKDNCIQSLISFPLRRNGKLIGFLGADNPQKHYTNITHLSALGDYMAVILTRRDYEHRLLSDSAAMQSLIQGIPGGFVQFTRRDNQLPRLGYCNDQLRDLLGFTTEQLDALYGHSVFEMIDPHDCPITEAALTYMGLSGKPWSGDLHIRRADNSYALFTVHCKKSITADGEVVFYVFFASAMIQPDLKNDSRRLMDALPCAAGIYEYQNGKLHLIYLNEAYQLMMHRTGREYLGLKVFEAVHPDDLPLLKSRLDEGMRGDGIIQFDFRCVNGHGQYVLLHAAVRKANPKEDSSTLYATFTLATDQVGLLHTALLAQKASIDRERETAKKLEAVITAEKHRSAVFSMLFVGAAEGKYDIVLQIDLSTGVTSRLNFIDGAFTVQPRVESWDVIFNRLLTHVHPDDKKTIEDSLNSRVLGDAPDGTSIELTYRRHLRGNLYHWFSARFRIFKDKQNGHSAIGLLSDINTEMEEQSRLHDLAERDIMTDLFNRSKLESMTQGEYKTLNACGVIFFDLNGLKNVNDHQGHCAGDTLLRAMADGIRSITSRRIHAYRYGGDEFVVVVCNGDEAELHQLTLLCQKQLEVMEQSGGIHVAAAVGYAWRQAPFELDALISEADSAMYADKQKNRSGVRQ